MKAEETRIRLATEATALTQALTAAQEVITRQTTTINSLEQSLVDVQRNSVIAAEKHQVELNRLQNEVQASNQQCAMMSETMSQHIMKIEEQSAVADTHKDDLLMQIGSLKQRLSDSEHHRVDLQKVCHHCRCICHKSLYNPH